MNKLVFKCAKCYNILENSVTIQQSLWNRWTVIEWLWTAQKGDIPLSDNKSKKMPGILARLRMVVGLNIGTIMFGILFIRLHQDLYPATKHIPALPYVKKVYARQIHQAILLIMQGRAVRSMLPERCTDLVIQKQLLLRHLLPRKNFQRYGLIWWVFPKDLISSLPSMAMTG